MEATATLHDLLGRAGAVVVAYSGGIDSAFLADVANEVLGDRANAVTAVSASLAARERTAAWALAESRGWRHAEIDTGELTRAAYRRNDGDRCFQCKDALFDVLDVIAVADGAVVCVGTNLDDLTDHRPGLRAAADHGVAQPLVDAGFTKAMIRAAASERGLPIADKPATPCLASRIAYGIEVTAERLERIGRAEAILWAVGASDVRVRDLGDRARIELPTGDLDLLGPEARDGILEQVRSLGFGSVDFDPRGLRSGSMNELIGIGRPSASTASDVG